MTDQADQDPLDDTPWNLIPLTPQYSELEHGKYVSALESALLDDDIHNIALSGNYGVGKSSILKELAMRHDKRVVELSLSTLSPAQDAELDDAIPAQATTPTNRIQQEIVKQLLYRENPNKTPASRFHRIESFQLRREILAFSLLGLILAVAFLLAGWTTKIAAAFTILGSIGIWTHLVIWGAATSSLLFFRWLSYGKLHIKQFSAGAATVTLDENSVSYFDQYLDEIIYFFEVSKRDVVIFEDIDRFDDSHIFETLRALNTLLNRSPQTRRTIRFIYAIRDSIFDQSALIKTETSSLDDLPQAADPAVAEIARANRTKFFDLIIPVVPFITHRSARNLATKLLSEIEHDVDLELLDTAIRYVPDMRLLKNTLNEFVVFRDRIFSGDGKNLDLDETQLFAMMLYKSTNQMDFENIRFGKSNLDKLYGTSRKLVSENIEQLESRRRKLRDQLTRIDRIEYRSAQLGKRLLEYAKDVGELIYGQGAGEVAFTFKGESIADIENPQFWTTFMNEPDDQTIVWDLRPSCYCSLEFRREFILEKFGEPFDTENWNSEEQDTLSNELREVSEDIANLRGADFNFLLARPDFTRTNNQIDESFSFAAEKILGSGLAYQLMKAGYIDRNFTLYTSTFHGDRVSTAATNFIIHHAERGEMDPYFKLDPEDVDAVIRELGQDSVKQPALYNIEILDHLLETKNDAAHKMISSLDPMREKQQQFYNAYLTGGKKTSQFIERFAALSSNALYYLLSNAQLDDASLLKFVDATLASLPSSKQRVESEVIRYFKEHYTEFSIITEDRDPAQVEKVADLFAKAGVAVPLLTPLSEGARTAFVSRNLYEISRENIAIAIDNQDSVALDTILETDRTVYEHVLEHLDAYLEVVQGSSATVDSGENFIAVLEDLIEQERPQIPDVIKHASPECRVTNLDEISTSVWPALASNKRFPETFLNVSLYVDEYGVDLHLAQVLTDTEAIIEIEEAAEKQKLQVAMAVLEAQEVLPSPALRANLVASLNLRDKLQTRQIPTENSELFALLLKHGRVADTADSYKSLATTDWDARKAYIRESEKFAEYMTPELLQTDLSTLLTDDEVDNAIKLHIVEQSYEYVDIADGIALSAIASFAVHFEIAIPPESIKVMAKENVSSSDIVVLLGPHLERLEKEQLFGILESMGGEYAKLTSKGREHVHVPHTDADIALLNSLKNFNIVSSFKIEGSEIEVHRKRK